MSCRNPTSTSLLAGSERVSAISQPIMPAIRPTAMSRATTLRGCCHHERTTTSSSWSSWSLDATSASLPGSVRTSMSVSLPAPQRRWTALSCRSQPPVAGTVVAGAVAAGVVPGAVPGTVVPVGAATGGEPSPTSNVWRPVIRPTKLYVTPSEPTAVQVNSVPTSLLSGSVQVASSYVRPVVWAAHRRRPG